MMVRRPLAHLRSPGADSRHLDFVYMHIDLAAQTHATGLFLPWHRWYVQTYEDTLRAVCNLTTASPYWDWRLGM
jgi:hypothetical protein